MARLNRYQGSPEFNARKPWSINRYGVLEGNRRYGPTSVYAPDNFPRYHNNKYWWMWDIYVRSVNGWRVYEWNAAGVPDLRSFVLSCAGGSGSNFGGNSTAGVSAESGSNRPGGDYHSFNLPSAQPSLCQAACANDPRCKAYTYVRPGVQGPAARCWLKSTAPNPVPDARCVSGVKGGQGGGGTWGDIPTETCQNHDLGNLFSKWAALGRERSVLGCPVISAREAGRSPQGTYGRYAEFRNGYIVWHRTGAYAGWTFAVHGGAYKLYKSMYGSNSWLGFPISDSYRVQGGERINFEGGFIFTEAGTDRCQAYRYTGSGAR